MNNFKKILIEMLESVNANDYIQELEKEIKKIFPNSYLTVKYTTNLDPSIVMRFALGKDKSQWNNGIIENDQAYHILSITGKFDEDGTITSDKIHVNILVGGSIYSGKNKNMKYKVGWKKKTGKPDQVLKHVVKYFEKMKDIIVSEKFAEL